MNIKQYSDFVKATLASKNPATVVVQSKPGIGVVSTILESANEIGVDAIDIRCGQMAEFDARNIQNKIVIFSDYFLTPKNVKIDVDKFIVNHHESVKVFVMIRDTDVVETGYLMDRVITVTN